MANKSELHIIKGMMRDLSISKFNPEYAFECKNIRITARDNNTLLSVTNEKGTLNIPLKDSSGTDTSVVGTLIGYNVLNNYVTLFTTSDKDYIYRLERKKDYFESILLFTGSLGFSDKNPIENIGVYENEDIQKVYWVDGINQTRVINIAATPEVKSKWNKYSFDFVLQLSLNEVVSILRSNSTSGVFASGTILYAFSYYNQYGLESNIFYVSPIQYVSFLDRGASPEEKVSNSFTITINNADIRFEYIRIYSIHRTSIDATPTVKVVTDLAPTPVDIIDIPNPTKGVWTTLSTNKDLLVKIYDGKSYNDLSQYRYESSTDPSGNSLRTYYIQTTPDYVVLDTSVNFGVALVAGSVITIIRTLTNSGSVSFKVQGDEIIYGTYVTKKGSGNIYVDTGTSGYTVDPTELLYIGGEEVVFKTMTLKDNTLFLGNAYIKKKLISSDVIEASKKKPITFSYKSIGNIVLPSGGYPYKNSLYLGSKIKTFKYLEWYRFGTLFLYKNGKWSEPIWNNDSRNNLAPREDSDILLVKAKLSLTPDIINKVVSEGFVRARGVVVYPSLIDREVKALGILCPTVYNVLDRFNNAPFALASWYTRPSLSFDTHMAKDLWTGLGWNPSDYTNSKAAVIRNSNTTYNNNVVDIVNKGAWAEFRHNFPIPNNWERNSEILCIANTPLNPLVEAKGSDLYKWVTDHLEYFFVDLNIVTFHSPDIEFDEDLLNIDSSSLKLRIVGKANMTANTSDISVQTTTPQFNIERRGFYTETVGTENMSVHGLKSSLMGMHWIDSCVKEDNTEIWTGGTFGYPVYPWHRNGSLNNQGAVSEGSRSAFLDKKKISNLKFSVFTSYFDSPWNAQIDSDSKHTGITPVSIFKSKEASIVRIPAPINSGLDDINYYGNIDKMLNSTFVDLLYNDPTANPGVLNRKEGYPIIITNYTLEGSISEHEYFVSDPKTLNSIYVGGLLEPNRYGKDPIRIKYKSTPHAVFALNYTGDGLRTVLPTTMETDGITSWTVNDVNYPFTGVYHNFWNPKARLNSQDIPNDGVYLDVINGVVSNYLYNIYGYSFIAELYSDNILNRFGGLTEEAFENNQWLPAGDPVSLIQGYDINDNPVPKTSVTVEYTEGDTFFLRYDCLKTYPFTLEDLNSITEIASFLCETRVNIEGRYDKNRGLNSNLVMTPEIFNKMNPVYNLRNNFFNYRGINHTRFSLNYFPNTVTWTKEKLLGSLIDSWANVTMASTLDLDGDKGEIVSLNTFNNEIYCFLRRGLSNIIFNARILIPTSDNVPIEITNGLKVSGKRYISNSIGCSNKWSIVESPSGLYFIDNETNSLYLFNGKIESLSDKLGLRQWIGLNNSHEDWNPVDYKNFRSFYDKNNNDVYFTNKTSCLCYSELLGLFTSFMSYENVPAMFNITSDFYSFNNNLLWENFAGKYNLFYGTRQPYYIDIVANAEEPYDKIFNTVEFRADAYSEDILSLNSPYNKLEVYNEYLKGVSTLSTIFGNPSSLKRKFRVWRADIPRANTPINGITSNGRDRIRNTWAHVRLISDTEDTNRTEFHDMTVHYTV